MKKLLRFLFVAVVGLSVLSCYDDSALREAIDKHEQMLMDLQDRCAEMNADIESLHTLIAAVQNADYITSITPITEGGKEVGYTIVFAKYGTVTIKNGADGAKGEDGAPSDAVPVIGAKQDTDGVYYWTVDGEWLTDDAGNKVPASGKDGADGADGEKGDQGAPGAPGADGSAGAPGVEGVTPELKIEQDYWYVSYDGGKTWTQLGRATGEDGKDGANGGDSIFKDVYEKDGYVYFVLSDGTTYKVPMTATAAPAALDITFDVESEMFVVPDEEYMIPYTIIGADEKTSVRVITNPSYVSAYVIPETSSTGSISVRVAPNYGWESEEFYQSQLSFMVTVMDGRGNSVVKAVNLKKGILSLYDSAYTVDKEGGQLSVLVKTNMEYEVVVQSEVTWLSYSPKTKSEIRTDELLFNVQPNEEKTSRNTEVYLVDNDGNHLESIYIYQRGNGGSVVMDGDFSDWGQLDSCDVVVSTCAPDAYKNGLKTMMAFADGENLNVYLEMDFDVVVDRGEEWEGNPVDIYLSYSPDTGGYDNWSDMCVDYLLELQVFYGKHSYSSDDFVQLYSWTGGTHDGGWNWEQITEVQVQVARTYNLCEIAINQRVLEELSGTPVDEFSIGATVSQWWESVGILPNVNVTDENPRGMAPMLALNGENNAPLPPVGPVDPIEPEVSVVGLIGDFNKWSDDLIMYDNGEGWYVAQLYVEADSEFKFRLDGMWDTDFGISWEMDNTAYPGTLYDLTRGANNIRVPVSGDITVYLSDDFTQFKYEAESAAALYFNDFDREEATKSYGASGTSWPYLDEFNGWMNHSGEGSADVEYAYAAMSARANSFSNASYSDYPGSGLNNLFFGNNAYFAVQNIALNGAADLALTFGTEKYSPDNGSVFTNSEFHIWLSKDGGYKWVELTDYTFAGGTTEGRWNVASANFTVPSGTETLSICMKTDVASSYRLDDLKLEVAATEGTYVDFSNAVEKDFAAGGSTGGGTTPEGTGEGTQASPYDAAKAHNVAATLADGEKITGVYVKGKITEIKEVSTSYGNATYYITDATGAAKFYVYRGYALGNVKFTSEDEIKVGDEVLIYGDLMNYKGNSPQLGQGNYIVELNGGSGGGGEEPEPEDPVDPSEIQTVTVAEFNAMPVSTSVLYRLTGTVGGPINTKYGNFDLIDETGKVYVYGISNWSDYSATFAEGGTVTVVGQRGDYNGKIEVLEGYIESYTAPAGGGDDSGETPEDPVTPEGKTLTLTNEEICKMMTSSSSSYVDYTIESASGDWTVNASQLSSNTFLQCRGKKGAYIKTPLFENDIKSVTIHFSEAKTVYANNVYCAFPSTWTVPTADAAYPEDGNVGRAVTDGSYSLTIPVDAGNNQVYISIIGTYAYYLDHIDVAF